MEQSKNLNEVKNRLWLCMKECLTYSWQCLIYADKVRKKSARDLKIGRVLIHTMIVFFSCYFIVKFCLFGLDWVTMVIGVFLSFMSGIFTITEYCRHCETHLKLETNVVDELSKTYKLLYQKYCSLYLQCCSNNDVFDMSVNDEINRLVRDQDMLLPILNMECKSMSKSDDEEVKERVEQTLKEIFYNDVEQCPVRN